MKPNRAVAMMSTTPKLIKKKKTKKIQKKKTKEQQPSSYTLLLDYVKKQQQHNQQQQTEAIPIDDEVVIAEEEEETAYLMALDPKEEQETLAAWEKAHIKCARLGLFLIIVMLILILLDTRQAKRIRQLVEVKIMEKASKYFFNTKALQECQKPNTQIAFVKVHKTASTTVTSLLQRFGLVNNLTFALPSETNWRISLHESINDNNVMPIHPHQEYDILCQHVVYNKTAFEKYLPKNVRLVTTVREPFERFLSELLFFPQYRAMIMSVNKNITDTQTLVKVFLENPSKYQSRDFTAINRMAHDLGITESQCNNIISVKDHIQQMDKDFDLVMLAEKMDESLVFLKRLMCWSTKDILYQWRYKGRGRPQFGQDLMDMHKKLAYAEYQIYRHFSMKFRTLLSSQRTDFFQETKIFKQNLIKTFHFCKSDNFTKPLYFPASEFDNGFYITRTDCKIMKTEEMSFVSYLKRVQSNDYIGTDHVPPFPG